MREITYREAVQEALAEELERDPKVFLIGEDIGPFGGTNKATLGLYDRFGPERVRNTPISESAIIGAAIGAAVTGMRPVAEIMFVDFIAVGMDQIANQAAKLRYMTGGQTKLPLTIRTPGGAGRSSAAQHAQSLEAWLLHVPGLYVVMPATPKDVKGLIKSAVRNDNPTVVIEHKLLYNTSGPVPEGEYNVPIGLADVKREGTDLTVIATSRMVLHTLKAAGRLKEEGISIEVVDPRTLHPLDMDTIGGSVEKTGRVLIVHEACERCGFGAELAARIGTELFDYLDAPIQRLAAANVPMPFAPVLESYAVPQMSDIVRVAKGMMKGEM